MYIGGLTDNKPLPTFPTLPPHLSPHLSHLTTSPPSHLSQLATSPSSHLSHFATSLPCHLSKLVTLVFRDLTVAISITINKTSHSLIEAQPLPCNTNLRLPIPHTSNSPTPHIYSTPSVLTSFK